MWPVKEEMKKLRRDGNVVTLLEYAKEATKGKGIDSLHACLVCR